MGVSSAALQRYIKEENTPAFEVIARLCIAAGARMVQLAAEALGERTLPPEKHAELVSLIYEGLMDGLPEARILRFARLAAP